MNRFISFFILLFVVHVINAQNTVGRVVGKKVAKESTEQITKKVMKETAEEASEKIFKNVADDAASPIYKRAVRKGVVNSTSKSSIAGKKNNAYKYHKNKYNKRGKQKLQLTFDEILAINQIGEQNISFVAKSLNISSDHFRNVIRKELTYFKTDRVGKVDIKKAVHCMKTRIEELRTNPQLAKEIFNDEELLINEYTLAHLFPRHGQEFTSKSFQDIMSEMKSVYKNGVRSSRPNEGGVDNIAYTLGNKILVFRDAKPKPYIISYYTKS